MFTEREGENLHITAPGGKKKMCFCTADTNRQGVQSHAPPLRSAFYQRGAEAECKYYSHSEFTSPYLLDEAEEGKWSRSTVCNESTIRKGSVGGCYNPAFCRFSLSNFTP